MTTPMPDCATWREIEAQPRIWRDFADPLALRSAEIRRWMAAGNIRRVWLCGAGTSAFIGDTIAAAAYDSGLEFRSVATTDLVSAPQDFLPAAGTGEGLLLVQFGRSGDSPESLGTLDLVDRHLPRARHLAVTCNPRGALATRRLSGEPERGEVLLLPETTHDRGFAMTSSYTTMLLSGLACFDVRTDPRERLPRLADAAERLIGMFAASRVRCPGRAIFLGSGPLKGVARESALKVLELTAGRIVTLWDSAMGFRHGPKASVDDDSLIVVMVHPDERTGRYDRDAADEIRRQFPAADVLTMGGIGCDVELGATGDALWDTVLYVLLAQVRATQWSALLSLNVDDPFSAAGNLSRVVAGVTLYPYAA